MRSTGLEGSNLKKYNSSLFCREQNIYKDRATLWSEKAKEISTCEETSIGW